MTRLAAACLAAVLLWLEPAGAQSLVSIYFIDVGQGDAVLVRTSDNHSVLYDAGTSDVTVVNFLAKLGIERLDLAIASHNHIDHIGGLSEVVRRFRPRFYMDNGIPTTTVAYRTVLENAKTVGAELLEPTYRRIKLSEEVTLTVFPPPGKAEWDQNDNSVPVVLAVGQFRMTLAGDAQPLEWAWLSANHPEFLARVQVHKSSHHGSENGDTAAALAALSPKLAVIGVGSNSYGHPSPSTLRLLAGLGTRVLRTDEVGTVVVEPRSSGEFSVRTERPDPMGRVATHYPRDLVAYPPQH